ncbi:MAG TPA: radical SAM protein, partial [Allocoleopsis sp.]
MNTFTSVYGPVSSWRYGTSLGIDPIGSVSICSFNCVYCQLGEIEKQTLQRDVYIPTKTIISDLQGFAPWDVDIITLSGSGEPTLAANLGEIISQIKNMTNKPVLVLTNATLLSDIQVRKELALADKVSIKLDGLNTDQVRRINRPIGRINFKDLIKGIKLFCEEYQGELGIQTMVLNDWNEKIKTEYLELLNIIKPDEVQLNTPSRPKPLKRELSGRENHQISSDRSLPVQVFKCVNKDILAKLSEEIT